MTETFTTTAPRVPTVGEDIGEWLKAQNAEVTGYVEYDSKTPLKDFASELRAKAPKLNRKARRAGVAQSRTAGWKRMFNAAKANVMGALGEILDGRKAEADAFLATQAAAKTTEPTAGPVVPATAPSPYGR